MVRAPLLALVVAAACAAPEVPSSIPFDGLPLPTGIDSAAWGPAVPVDDVEVNLDPYGEAPLTAVVTLVHPDLEPTRVLSVDLSLSSDHPACETVEVTWDPRSPAYQRAFGLSDWPTPGLALPVLGLCPAATHTATFAVHTPAATFLAEATLTVGALPLVEGETVTVAVADTDRMAPGWTWVDGRVYDTRGTLRWVGPRALTRLPDGTFLSGISTWNLLGREVIPREMPPGVSAHHDTLAMPDGHLLICASTVSTIVKHGRPRFSTADLVIELDDVTGEEVNRWDLRQLLDVDRETVAAEGGDWFHLNTLAYDPVTDAIVVSGRYQGVAMITRGGEHRSDPGAGKSLVWLLAPHLDWGLAGRDGAGPFDPRGALLTAVDGAGSPYPQAVQDNLEAPTGPDDFHWPVGQHGLELERTPDGTLRVLLFDNLGSFLFDGPGTVANGVTFTRQGDLSNDRAQPPYSLLLELAIDEAAGSVRQVFAYGADRPELYGSFNGGVARFPEVGTRMLISNGIDQLDPDDTFQPHLVEVAEDWTVVFELRIEGATASVSHGGRVDLLQPWTPAAEP